MTEPSLPFKLGDIITEFYKVIQQEFSIYNTELNEFMALVNIDNRHGNDLDRTGDMYGLPRLSSETDTDYRDRLKLIMLDLDKIPTLEAINIAAERYLGELPEDILEYPEFDFLSLTGKSYPGILIQYEGSVFSSLDIDRFVDFTQYVKLFKAAGVPTIFDVKYSFTEHIVAEDILSIFTGGEFFFYFTENVFAGNTATTDNSDTFMVGRSYIRSTGSDKIREVPSFKFTEAYT